MKTDLPSGHRWATAMECEAYTLDTLFPTAVVVKRTMDSNGQPYTQGEADLALPRKDER